jgi:hypothetical protein
MFRNWLKGVFQTKPTSRTRARPSVEALEDRTTPSILFTPTLGTETATTAGGPVLGSSSDVHIYLVFWGPYWNSSAGRAYSDQILHSIDPMLYDSPYLNSLHQYGVQHRAYNDPRPGTGQAAVDSSDPNAAVDSRDPNSGFGTSDVKARVVNAINDGMPFDSNNIYLVITQPGAIVAANPDGKRDGAYHSYDTVRDRSSGQIKPLYFGWIGTNGTLDYATALISHEVVETMTDPRPGGWKDYTVFAPDNDNEIADREAQAYHYRINGYLVQSYWSQSDGAFRVDDGNSQSFYVKNNQLVINGDQFGYGYGDTISIDVNAAGGVSVTLNGEVVSFEPDASLAPDAISSIVVNTGAGSNSVWVHNEAQHVGLTINDGGNDEVFIGNNGSVQGIRGAVQIYNPSYRTDLVIDDSADTSAQTAFISDQDVYGLAPADIYFHTNSLSSLTIFGGSGGNTFDIVDTPATFNGSFPGYTWISTGAGVDLVYVAGTTGNLYLDGESGHDYVYVGTDPNTTYPMPGNGTLANIKGFVNVFNPSGVTTLVVDDGGDTAGHTATLNGTSLTGLSAGGTIYWTPTSSSVSGGVDELHIYGSAASSAYYVTDTPNLAFGIDLRTGIGNDAVFITGTTGGIGMYNYGGYDSVYVGNGTLAGVNGSVNVAGAGSTYLIVQDYLDATSHNATLTGYGLMGLSVGTIWWQPSSTATGGVTYLKILDGAGSSTYTVTDTPNLLYPTELNTGSGNDSVSIAGTTGSLNVINPDGFDSVDVGGGGTLANVNGSVNVSGNGSTFLYVDDYLDTAAHTATLTATSLTGLSRGAIQWVPSTAATGGVIFLDITGSAAGSTYTVTDTPHLYYPTDLNTGTGSDAVNITGTTGDLYLYNRGGYDNVYVGNGTLAGINGTVYVYGAGSTSLYVQDGNDTTARSATLTATNLTGLSAGAIQWSPSLASLGGVTYLRIDGSAATSTYNVTDTPNLYFFTDLITGAGNDSVNISGTSGFLNASNGGGYDSVYVGNGTLAGINGSVYVTGAGSTYLYVQDYSDTTARSATLNGYSLTGLSTGSVWWAHSSTATGGVTYLRIAGSSASSTYNVTDTPNVLYSTDLYTGAGNDTVNITGTTGTLNVGNVGGYDGVNVGNGSLANVNGSVNVSGAGSANLIVDDSGDATAHSATLTGTRLTGLSRGAIQWVPSGAFTGGVVFLDIIGSAAGSTYTVTDTPNLAYYTDLATGPGSDSVYVTGTTGILFVSNDGGADTLVIGRQASATTGGKLAGIKGRVVVNGYATVAITVDDSGDTNGRSATVTSNGLTGLVPAGIYFDTNIVTSLTINGGNGDDTLTLASSPNFTVAFSGGNGNDTLVGANTGQYWDITGTGVGNVAGNVNFSSVENLVGGTGVDTFWFEPGARVTSIDGGGAPAGQGDWLDYANYAGAVSANLATGKVSGVTGTASGIRNVFGGNFGNTLTGNAQGNILIGGDGADTITGGGGRSILIGGKGADTITGGADDDILIGGYTSYGSAWHEAELMDLLARWQSANSYATRVADIRGGYHPLALGTTVFDDGAADRVSGAGGTDWFWAGANDGLPDRQAGETVN